MEVIKGGVGSNEVTMGRPLRVATVTVTVTVTVTDFGQDKLGPIKWPWYTNELSSTSGLVAVYHGAGNVQLRRVVWFGYLRGYIDGKFDT